MAGVPDALTVNDVPDFIHRNSGVLEGNAMVEAAYDFAARDLIDGMPPKWLAHGVASQSPAPSA